jgi:hypothetical protein
MPSALKRMIDAADDRYLSNAELEDFQTEVQSLRERLAAYESLRDAEIQVFQMVANKLLATFPQEETDVLERAICHWIAIFRYGAMAMLLNDPNHLQIRILEWLAEIVHVQELLSVSDTLYQLLVVRVRKALSEAHFELIRPYLQQAQTYLQSAKDQPILEQPAKDYSAEAEEALIAIGEAL